MSLHKRHNVAAARRVASDARAMLGANGIIDTNKVGDFISFQRRGKRKKKLRPSVPRSLPVLYVIRGNAIMCGLHILF